MFKSITYGQLTELQAFERVVLQIDDIKRKGYDYFLYVGTDSQSYAGTNVVTTIVVYTVSKGGIFFSYRHKIKRFEALAQKIYAEVGYSIPIAESLRTHLREVGFSFAEVYEKLIVDIDVGEDGPTSQFIAGVTGWVTGCGFKWRIKPDSIASSRVSDKISKRGGDSDTVKPHVREKDKRKKK